MSKMAELDQALRMMAGALVDLERTDPQSSKVPRQQFVINCCAHTPHITEAFALSVNQQIMLIRETARVAAGCFRDSPGCAITDDSLPE